MWRKSLLAAGVVGALLLWRLSTKTNIVSVQRPLMGTTWTIQVADRGRPDAARQAIDQAYEELSRIDRLMSEWKPESPLSAINAAAGRDAVEVPAELRAILERSIRWSEVSHGVFDITWRGMGKIWHFDDSFVPPTPEAVAKARPSVNYRAIEIEGNKVRLRESAMNIGLGGIAKGYAVDRASEMLVKAGFPNSLVDGGGDVRVSGTKDGAPWRLGIQDPRAERGKLIGVVPLSDACLATSGDYERFRIVNGVRYHHIIDPRTGYPATESQSVTVIAPACEQAVVLAKVVFILGEEGMAIARREKVEVLWIDSDGKREATEKFPRMFEGS